MPNTSVKGPHYGTRLREFAISKARFQVRFSALMDKSAVDDLGFTVRRRKNGDVEVLHHGRLASTLRGIEAMGFLEDLKLCSEAEAQQLMARLTGNYKRGNERRASKHHRNQ